MRVPPLASSTADGKPYERSATVHAEICKMLSLPQSCWIREAENLQNETLIFLIRQTHHAEDELRGQLLEELRKRIMGRARRFVQSLDDLAAEEIVLNVEIEILEAVLTNGPSRKADYLEIAFAQAVERLTIDATRKHNNSPMGHRGEVVADATDEDGDPIERPIEFIPDDRPNPEDTLLNLQRENRRHELLRRACDAVKDRRRLKAVILHYAHGWPITSKYRGKPNLSRHFRANPRQIKYWIATSLDEMRAALGIKNSPPRRSVSTSSRFGIDEAAFGKERFVLTHNGKPAAAIAPMDDLAAIEALEHKIDPREAPGETGKAPHERLGAGRRENCSGSEARQVQARHEQAFSESAPNW